MAAANLKKNLLETLERDVGASDFVGSEQIYLTPYLALACSLLYMMASDGELEAEESSQLQAVLGGDEVVLSYALRYVQSVPIEQFFLSASEVLSVKDKWCILANVCDALLSDGHAAPAELALFAQMSSAFGVREAQFEPYFKILALKNDKSVLGRYAGVREERQPMTPHFALAIALLYMLTADGAIGKQEVGQLEAVIGEFDGLQNVALKYVRSVKLKPFLDEAAALLRPEQKIYILMNVCDSMLSDGEVAHLEDKLFLSMLIAFGFTEKNFARYWQVLETKNFKPFDTSSFKNNVSHERVTGGDATGGIIFKNEFVDASATSNELQNSANQSVWISAASDTTMSQFIVRTMDENIQSVSDDFGDQKNVVKVGLNATDSLISVTVRDSHGASKNRQSIDAVDAVDNVQKIQIEQEDINRQRFESVALDENNQELDVEARAKNIQEVTAVVSQRLDRFEKEHLKFLQIGRAQKFSDSFVLIEDNSSDANRQLVDKSYARFGLGAAASVDSLGSSKDVNRSDTEDGISGNLESHSTSVHSSEDSVFDGRSETITAKAHIGFSVLRLRSPSALWMRRSSIYFRLFTVSCTIMFAVPINTRPVLGRSFAGPLIVAPTFVPESGAFHRASESDLPTTQ